MPDIKVLRADLKHAGVRNLDADGRFIYFHSLPKSYTCSGLLTKVSQQTRQQQMRHFDPGLTEMTYVHEPLLPVRVEGVTSAGFSQMTSPADHPSLAPLLHRSHPICTGQNVAWRLHLAPPYEETTPDVETLIVTGFSSRLQLGQTVVKAMAGNKATRHDAVPGH